MKGFKKIVALGIVATMVMGSSLTAFASESTRDITTTDGTVEAAEQTVTGEATENYINKKVFKIVAPTTAWEADVFDFITDPQGLIAATNAAQAGSNLEIFDDTGVFFKNKNEEGTVYAVSSTSDPLILTNKSTSGVKIAVTVQLKEASSGKYQGGYSTTADFSTTADAATGLYLGLTSTGNPVTALNASATTLTSYAKSAYELFEVTYDNGYTFAIPAASAEYAPTYEFVVNGALNRALDDQTWYTVTDGKPLTVGAALAVPDIELKYTPTYVDARQCRAYVDENGITMYNWDETPFASEAAVTAGSIKVNGKAVADVAKCTEDGYLVIPIASIYTAFGASTDEEKAAVFDYIQGVEATVGGVAMYANIG